MVTICPPGWGINSLRGTASTTHCVSPKRGPARLTNPRRQRAKSLHFDISKQTVYYPLAFFPPRQPPVALIIAKLLDRPTPPPQTGLRPHQFSTTAHPARTLGLHNHVRIRL